MRDSLKSLKLNTNIISPYDTMLWYHLEEWCRMRTDFTVPFYWSYTVFVLLQELDI